MRPRRRATTSALPWLACAGALVTAPSARAAEPEVTSETAAQLYEVRSPSGETVLARRRFMTTLGVATYDLSGAGERRNGPELTFRARVRYDADYGADEEEASAAALGRFVPGFSRGPVDLMYGYVEGRRYAGGWLAFRLGRQYQTDTLGWWSFDGAQLRATTPFFLGAEAYGGLEVRGGMPMSTPRFERDGVWRGSRTGLDPALYPSYQPSAIAPAVGGAVETVGLPWIHARVSYRRVLNTGSATGAPFASGLREPYRTDGARVSQERLGASVDGQVGEAAGAKAGLVHDLFLARTTNVFASVDAYASRRVTVSVDYDYFRPSFDGDSIWNFFTMSPMNDLGARTEVTLTERVAASAGSHARVLRAPTAPSTDDASPFAEAAEYARRSAELVGGGHAALRYRTGEAQLGARAVVDAAASGGRSGVDVYGERVLETRYVFRARANVFRWTDSLRASRDATNVGYVAGVGYRFRPRNEAMVEVEHNVNRLVGHRFRLMLWLTLAVVP